MDTKPRTAYAPPTMSTTSAPVPLPTTHSSTTALQDITFGSIAGTVGKIVEYPFDTVKVRLQSQPDHLPLRYTGPLDCFRQSIRSDGIRSLYRGVSAPLAGAAAETACLFWSYNLAQEVLRNTLLPGKAGANENDLPLGALVAAGGISGAITSLLLTPIELVKCRMQVPMSGQATKMLSPLTVVRDIFHREGLPGFWRGQLGTFLRETGGTAAWFGAYEATTSFFRSRLPANQSSLPMSTQLLSGAIAGMSYNFLFYPADTIKSKIQTGELSSHLGRQQTFLTVGRELWQTHGLRGLYRGCGITVARSAPSSALIFAIVERLKTTFA